MSTGTAVTAGIDDLKKLFNEITDALKDHNTNPSSRPQLTIPTAYNPIIESLIKILQKIGEDIDNFVELDIRTEVKKADQLIAVYETKYEINGNITNTYPDSIDQTIWTRHNNLVDSSIQDRKKEVITIIQILSEIVKIPIITL